MSDSPHLERMTAIRLSRIETAAARAPTPERIALEELVEAAEEYKACPYWDNDMAGARLTLALNAARNALHTGKVLDGIAADPSIGHGHVGSVG